MCQRFRNTLRGLTKTRGEFPVFSSCESFESPVERMMVKAGYWLNILATFSMMTADCPRSDSSMIRKWFLLNVDSVGGGAFLSSLTVGMLSEYLEYQYRIIKYWKIRTIVSRRIPGVKTKHHGCCGFWTLQVEERQQFGDSLLRHCPILHWAVVERQQPGPAVIYRAGDDLLDTRGQ